MERKQRAQDMSGAQSSQLVHRVVTKRCKNATRIAYGMKTGGHQQLTSMKSGVQKSYIPYWSTVAGTWLFMKGGGKQITRAWVEALKETFSNYP